MRHEEQRVLVLFDVQNLYYSAKHLYNQKVNFRALLKEAVAKRRLVRAISYVIKTDIKEESNFHDALNNAGIEVKSKDLQVFYGGGKKGDWDIGIAMDAVRMASKIDTLVLVSGDGDFKDLLDYLKSHGCRTEVMALGKTASKQLKEEADYFIDIEENLNEFLIGNNKSTAKKTKQTTKKTTKETTKKTTKKTTKTDAKPDTKPETKPDTKPGSKKESGDDTSQLDMVSSKLSQGDKSVYQQKQEESKGSDQKSDNDDKKEEDKDDSEDDGKGGFASRLRKLLSE